MSASTRVVLHIDFDCFYVQCVRRRTPSLVGVPVGIKQKAILATCSYEARAQGVGKLMRVDEALRRCPTLVLEDGSDIAYFREVSQEIADALYEECAAAYSECEGGREGGSGDGGGGGDGMGAPPPLVPSASPSGLQQRSPRPLAAPSAHPHLPLAPIIEKLGMEEFFLDVTEYAARMAARGRGGGAAAVPPGHVYDAHGEWGLPSPLAGGGGGGGSGGGGGGGSGGQHSSSSSSSSFSGAASPPPPPPITHAPPPPPPPVLHAARLARRLRARMWSSFSFTCAAGVCTSKLGAKVASGLHKPDDQTTLVPERVAALLAPRSVWDLPGVGYATFKKLTAAHIRTVADLVKFPAEAIAEVLAAAPAGGPDEAAADAAAAAAAAGGAGAGAGSSSSSSHQHNLALAETFLRLARGVDPSPVKPSGPPLTLSEEDSFRRIDSWAAATAKLRELVTPFLGRVLADAARHGRRPQTLRLTVRPVAAGGPPGTAWDATRLSRQGPMPAAVVAAAGAAAAAGAVAGEGGVGGGGAAAEDPAVPVLVRAALEHLRALMMGLGAGGGGESTGAHLPAAITLMNVAATNFTEGRGDSSRRVRAAVSAAAGPGLGAYFGAAAAAAAGTKRGRGGGKGGAEAEAEAAVVLDLVGEGEGEGEEGTAPRRRPRWPPGRLDPVVAAALPPNLRAEVERYARGEERG
jgi:nucleotidyltransferase/DNA polymerase involved in DNA repair